MIIESGSMITINLKSGLENSPTTVATAEADSDSYQAPDECQHQRFDQKLGEYIAVVRTQSFAQANLPCAFGDRHKHNVHNANAAHQQAYSADAAQKYRQRVGNRVGRFEQPGVGVDAEVVVVVSAQAAAQTQGLFDLPLGCIHPLPHLPRRLESS